VGIAGAARRILALADTMMQMQTSGVAVKEMATPLLPATTAGRSTGLLAGKR